MTNLTFGENNFTKDAAKKVSSKAEAKKTKASKEKETVENSSPALDPKILDVLVKINEEQRKVLDASNEMYAEYPTNELSVAINSMEMVLEKLESLLEKINRFGR